MPARKFSLSRKNSFNDIRAEAPMVTRSTSTTAIPQNGHADFGHSPGSAGNSPNRKGSLFG